MTLPTQRVLVVDDEWTIRRQLARALELAGIPCDCAVNGDEALDCFLHLHHKLVVTDLRMPKKNGHSLAVTLLEMANPPIVVALTGVTEPRLAHDLLTRGVADVVYKPLNYFEFVGQLKQRLDGGKSPPECAEILNEAQPAQSVAAPTLMKEPLYRNRRELEQLLMKSTPRHRWLTTLFQWIDWERISNPPQEIQNILGQLSGHPSHVPLGNRQNERIVLNERAVALTLDEEFEPVGQPFKVVVRDLSLAGIGFVHTEHVTAHPIAISWRGIQRNRLVVVTRVLRCRQTNTFFDVGAMILQLSDSVRRTDS